MESCKYVPHTVNKKTNLHKILEALKMDLRFSLLCTILCVVKSFQIGLSVKSKVTYLHLAEEKEDTTYKGYICTFVFI